MAATKKIHESKAQKRPQGPSEGRRKKAGTEASSAPGNRRVPRARSSGTIVRVTKNARLIELLMNDDGVDIATLSEALGWQTHTTRAALTRLRQAGHRLEATRPPEGGGKRYRIDAAPAAEPAE